MATLKDVALQTGLSVSAVSRILNEPDFAAPATRKRVLEAVESLGYVRNYMATRMKDGKSRQIALVINDINSQIYTDITRGVEEVCSRHGYTLLLCNTDDNLQRENKYFDLIRGKLCDGFIVSVVSETDSRLESINARETPYVMVSRRSQRVTADFVSFDDFSVGYTAGKHLAPLGHRRIADILGPSSSKSLQLRREGLRTALREYGVETDDSLSFCCDYREEDAYEQVKKILALKDRPSAILVSGNRITSGCYQCLQAENIRIPEEMAVLAFYEPAWAWLVNPGITCVDTSGYDIGRNAAELLFRRLNGFDAPPQTITIPVELIVRESCGEKRTPNP